MICCAPLTVERRWVMTITVLRVDGLLHGDFAFGVQRGGGFVQDDDGGVF